MTIANLSTYDITADIAPPNGPKLGISDYRCRFRQIDQDDVVYLGKDYGLAYFTGGFTQYSTFELDGLTGSSRVYPWVLSNKVGTAYRTAGGGSTIVAASEDDCTAFWDGTAWGMKDLNYVAQHVGYGTTTDFKRGGGMRFRSLNIQKGSLITLCRITFTCRTSSTLTGVKSRFHGELSGTPAAFSTTLAEYQDRVRTTAVVTWDDIASWAADTAYNSPVLIDIAQEIVDAYDVTDMVLFWDDHEGRTASGTSYRMRQGYSYDGTATAASRPTLTITHYPPGDNCIQLACATNTLYLREWYYGTTWYDSNGYTIPERYRFTPLFFKFVRAGTTLTCGIYSSSLRTAADLLDTLTLELQASLDYRYHYIMAGLGYADSGSTVAGMSGEFYEETPPAYFTVEKNHILFKPEDEDDFASYGTGWSLTTPDGATNEKATPGGKTGDWAHLIADDTEGDPGAVMTPTRVSNKVCMYGITVYYPDNTHNDEIWTTTNASQIIAVGKQAWEDPWSYVAAIVVRSGDDYYWRIRKYLNSSTKSTSTQTKYKFLLGKTYDVIFHIHKPTGYAFGLVYVRSDDDDNYPNWTVVDSYYLGTTGTIYGCGAIILGGGDVDCFGDRYYTDMKYMNWITIFGWIENGGVNDSILVLRQTRSVDHVLTSTNGSEIWMSTDHGETFDYVYTTTGALFGKYDNANSRWLSAAAGAVYSAADPEPDTEWIWTKLADVDMGDYTRVDHIIENNKLWMSSMVYLADTEHRRQQFGVLDLSAYTFAHAPMLCTGDIGGWEKPSEAYYYRRTSDSHIIALIKVQPVDEVPGDPDIPRIYMVECLDEPGIANEGLHMDSGTADGNTPNKLIDSGAEWLTTTPVEIGWSVWNTTDGLHGYVGAIDDAHTLSIVNYAGDAYDLFPDGDEDYELSCWGRWSVPEPTTGLPLPNAGEADYDFRGGWLGAFAFGGNLLMQGSNKRDSLDGSLKYHQTFVALADAEDATIIAERQWDYVGGETSLGSVGAMEVGNGRVDAAQIPGNHYIDFITNRGCTWYMKLDAQVAVAYSYYGKLMGIATASYGKLGGSTASDNKYIYGIRLKDEA